MTDREYETFMRHVKGAMMVLEKAETEKPMQKFLTVIENAYKKPYLIFQKCEKNIDK